MQISTNNSTTKLTLPSHDKAAPAEVFGALREGLHLAGYSFERAVKKLDDLLADDRWQKCGEFGGDVNKFLACISLADFRPTIEQRKSIALKLAKIKASQRAIAKVVGVSQATVTTDLKDEQNRSLAQKKPNGTKGSEQPSEQNRSPAPPPDSGRAAAQKLAEKDKRPRSGNSTHDNDDEWYTPPAIVEACRTAMFGIDLDPASHEVANNCVKADRYFTAEDDGLSQTWKGRVFLNPPYSRQAGKAAFIAKLAESFDAGAVTAATVVLSYDFSASWFEPLRGRYAAICLCRGRVQFYKETPGDGQNPALGTSLVYLGPNVARFAQAARALGDVVIPESPPRRAEGA